MKRVMETRNSKSKIFAPEEGFLESESLPRNCSILKTNFLNGADSSNESPVNDFAIGILRMLDYDNNRWI